MAKGKKAVVKLTVIEDGNHLIGTADADQFVIREGDGIKVVEGFDVRNDKLLFDFSSYSDVLLGPANFGFLHDGQEFYDFTGGTHFSVHAVDYNGDGLIDTQINANADSIIILGIAPDSMSSGNLMGG